MSEPESYSLAVARVLKEREQFDAFAKRRRHLERWGADRGESYSQACNEFQVAHLLPESRRISARFTDKEVAGIEWGELTEEQADNLLRAVADAATTDEHFAALRRLHRHVQCHKTNDWTGHAFGPRSFVEFIAEEGSDDTTPEEWRECHRLNELARRELELKEYERPPLAIPMCDMHLFDTLWEPANAGD
ncbi:MAG: hypothetical protein RIC55_21495 [Pirellulaceae bacterium]